HAGRGRVLPAVLRGRHGAVDVARALGARGRGGAGAHHGAVRGAGILARRAQVARRRAVGAAGAVGDAAASGRVAGPARLDRARELHHLPHQHHRHRPRQGTAAARAALGRRELPAVLPGAHARRRGAADAGEGGARAALAARRPLPLNLRDSNQKRQAPSGLASPADRRAVLAENAPVIPRPAHAYRPDIDGLRALAVLAVLGYHAFPGVVPGGFVGVDVFFVISGFLITGIILEEQRRGAFSFAGFYWRRIRRIFPALILVLTACLL